MRACIIAASVALWALGASAAEVRVNGQAFTVAEGLTLDLVATPAQVMRPVAGAFDDDGALYVADAAPGEPNAQGERFHVSQLLDSDGDGTFDRSFVYAEFPAEPRALLWQEDALYVAAGDTIWRTVAEPGGNVRREPWRRSEGGQLFGPWAQASDLWWLDTKQGLWRTTLAGVDECVMGLEKEGATMEAHYAALDFTPTGAPLLLLETMRSCIPPFPTDGLLPVALGQHFSRNFSGPFRFPGEAKSLLPGPEPMEMRMALRRYRGVSLGEPYRGKYFVARLGGERGLESWTLTPQGAGFMAASPTRLVEGDFGLQLDLVEDADGSLLVLDGGTPAFAGRDGREESPLEPGAIYRLRRAEAPLVKDPRGRELGWDRSQMGDFVVRLTDTRPDVVARAQRELAQTGDYAAFAIKQIIPDWPVPALKQTILWTLAPMRGYTANALIQEMLANKDPAVSETAARIVGLRGDDSAVLPLQELLQGEPSVARAAAEALTRLRAVGAVPALLAAAPGGADAALGFAFLHALGQLAPEDQLTAALAAGRPFTQRAAALVLAKRQYAGLPAAVRPWLASPEPVLKETAAWLFQQNPSWPRS